MIGLNKVDEPPYKLMDIFQEITTHVNSKLRILPTPVIAKDITFRFGYYTELLQTLQQENAPGFDDKKYPFIWLVQPFTIKRGFPDCYGKVKDKLRVFIVMESDKEYKAAQRETITFDPVLNPIYIQLLKSMHYNGKLKIVAVDKIKHDVTARYYWGEDQKQFIPDVADCIEIYFEDIIINHNQNC